MVSSELYANSHVCEDTNSDRYTHRHEDKLTLSLAHSFTVTDSSSNAPIASGRRVKLFYGSRARSSGAINLSAFHFDLRLNWIRINFVVTILSSQLLKPATLTRTKIDPTTWNKNGNRQTQNTHQFSCNSEL